VNLQREIFTFTISYTDCVRELFESEGNKFFYKSN